jgi:SpoVK/Ycf46/Vps4 family AAA+-type ATPase
MTQHYGKRIKTKFSFNFPLIRRFPRRIYIQLPDTRTRRHLLKHLLNKQEHSLNSNDFEWISM